MGSRNRCAATLLMAAAALLLAGCRTRTVVVDNPTVVTLHDTIYQSRAATERVYVRDSIVIGDTIYRDRLTAIEHIRTDTVYHLRQEPVEIIKTEIVEVDKPPSRWQQLQQRGFWIMFALALTAIVIRYRATLLKMLRAIL